MLKRLILYASALFMFTVGAILLGILIFPTVKIFSKGEKDYKQRCAAIVNKLWCFLIKYLKLTQIIDFEYDKKITKIENKIIVASHPSFIDIVLLIALIPNSLCLVKTSILNNFIMRNIVKSLYITNDGTIDDFLAKSKKALDYGFNIIIFPTGKRVDEGEAVQIHKGAAKLSILTKKSIVPIKITTSEPFLTKNRSIFQIGKNIVKFKLEIAEEINPDECFDENMTEISLRNKICSIIKKKI